MGMFDTVRISKELIGTEEDFVGQIKNPHLGCAMHNFIIDWEGGIKKSWRLDESVIRFLSFNYHGKLGVHDVTGSYRTDDLVITTYVLEYYMGNYIGFTKTVT